jgi:hypothetical protein
MKRIARYSVVVPAICVAAQPQQVVKKLAIHVAKEAETPIELGLLPGPEEVTNDDAFVLYEKAVGSLPKDLDWERVGDWRLTPAKELPLDDVTGVLRPFDASLALLEQAGRCSRCDWPCGWRRGTAPAGGEEAGHPCGGRSRSANRAGAFARAGGSDER